MTKKTFKEYLVSVSKRIYPIIGIFLISYTYIVAYIFKLGEINNLKLPISFIKIGINDILNSFFIISILVIVFFILLFIISIKFKNKFFYWSQTFNFICFFTIILLFSSLLKLFFNINIVILLVLFSIVIFIINACNCYNKIKNINYESLKVEYEKITFNRFLIGTSILLLLSLFLIFILGDFYGKNVYNNYYVTIPDETIKYRIVVENENEIILEKYDEKNQYYIFYKNQNLTLHRINN